MKEVWREFGRYHARIYKDFGYVIELYLTREPSWANLRARFIEVDGKPVVDMTQSDRYNAESLEQHRVLVSAAIAVIDEFDSFKRIYDAEVSE